MPGNVMMHSIYIRKAYVDLFSKILGLLESMKGNYDRATCVTGTPGVGKTFFGLFLALSKRNEAVH